MQNFVLLIIQERANIIFLNPSLLLLLLLSIFFFYKWISPSFNPKKNLPPSPPRLPIIGNLHQLGFLPFRSLQALSRKHGDLMLLHLGSKPTIIISSAEVASQFFKTHDLIFANRPILSIPRRLLGNGKDVLMSQYGDYWKRMRSIFTTHLLGNHKLRSFRKVREEEVALMIKSIQGKTTVNLGEVFMSLAVDFMFRVAFGKKYSGVDGGFKKMLDPCFKLLGGFNIGDFIGWMNWINKINGVDAEVKRVVSTFDDLLGRILDDHSRNIGDGDGEEHNVATKDFVDVLLEVQRSDNLLDIESIKGLILDIFTGGTETTATDLEWIMSELLRNPRVMQELQKEVLSVVGIKENVTEDDLQNMPYLKAVHKETLRLHTPAPLLFPHESSEDIVINGYDISAGTIAIVNVWAISRDPRYWEEPERFYPERFLNSGLDFKGHDFECTPFGSGRRICPGMGFATTTVELALANLVYHFDWSLPNGAKPESLNMDESHGVTAHRTHPLCAVPSPRIR